MNMSSVLKSFISGLVVLFCFTNCGGGFSATGDFDGSKVLNSLGNTRCDPVLSKAFNSGVYSFLRTNCKLCHHKGPGQGLFANENQSVAFETFKSFGYDRIAENAVDDDHARNYTGSQLQLQVDSLDRLWRSSQVDYNKCLAVENSSAKSQFDLLTGSSDLAVIDSWSVLSWDLNNNNFTSNLLHTFEATFKVDVQNYYGESDMKPADPIGLLFRRPRIEFTGSQDKIYIEGIILQSDGVPLEDFEVWSQLIVLIEKQTKSESVIINDSDRSFTYIYADALESIESLSVSFINIIDNTGGINDEFIPDEPNTIDVDDDKPVITRDITYADLTGTGEFAVFKNSCYKCHGNGETRNEFAIDDFTQAESLSSEIITRINAVDSTRMPKNGTLSLKDIAIIEKWVEGGSPQN